MANIYVDSAAGSNTSPYETWAKAATAIQTALTAAAAGDVVYVASTHVENPGATTAYTRTTNGSIICADKTSGEPPTTIATGAQLVAGAGAYSIQLDLRSNYVYGMTVASGTGATNANLVLNRGQGYTIYDTCTLKKPGTTGTANAIRGNDGNSGNGGRITLINTTLTFGATTDQLNPNGSPLEWKGTASALGGATFPSTLIVSNTTPSVTVFDGVDLDALSTGTIMTANVYPQYVLLKNCKLNASAAFARQTAPGGAIIDVVVADSGATNYRQERRGLYEGDLTTETTIVRTGGATDGTTPISHKIVTTANSTWAHPFVAFPYAIWNDTTGANVTVTVYGYWDAAAVPKNDEIWIEVSYLGSSATPISTINRANTKANFVTANADQGTDSSTWGGGDTTTRFAMSVTLSSPQPAMKGPIYVTVKAAKASSTFYVDPKVVLS